MTCYFAGRRGAGSCNGALIRAHLISKQKMRREFPVGVVYFDGYWQDPRAVFDRVVTRQGRDLYKRRTLKEIQDDPRCWVPCCGGPSGIGGHHGLFDGLKLRLAREELPPGVEQFASELGLCNYLDRVYGEPVAA